MSLATRKHAMSGASKFPWKALGLTAAAVVSSVMIYGKVKANKHESISAISEDYHRLAGHIPWLLAQCRLPNPHKGIATEVNDNKHGLVCFSKPQGSFMVYLKDPKLIKYVFSESFDKAGKLGDGVNERWREVFGKGIFVTDGDTWRFHRRIASRIFSMRNLKYYMFSTAQMKAKRSMAKIGQVTAKGEAIDMYGFLGRFTLESFIKICMGKSLDIVDSFPKQHPFSLAFDALMELAYLRNFNPIWKVQKAMGVGQSETIIAKHTKTLDTFFDQLLNLKKRKELIDESGVDRHDLISLYLKHKKDITRDELRDVTMNMIVAGRDTTRVLLSWFLVCMASRPQILAKVVSEIESVDTADHHGDLSFADCQNKLPFLESCLLETMRLWPVVLFSARTVQCKQGLVLTDTYGDPSKPVNHLVKKGTTMVIHHYSNQRNPKVFSNPNKFDPSRWTQGINTFSSEVFGQFNQAPRMCLGRHFAMMEAKTFVFHFLRKFQFKPVTTGIPKIKFGVLLQMADGYPIHVTPRVQD